jgi:hypothetical protein
MSKKDKKALFSHLVNLISHIIKWSIQPWERAASWINTIKNSRKAISDILKKNPSFKNLIDEDIPDAFREGTKDAEKETGLKSTKKDITKKELFDDDYKLDE